jgi:hypothetical protein
MSLWRSGSRTVATLRALTIAGCLPALACHGSSSDADIDRITQGVAEGKRVTVTVHTSSRPGEAAHDHRVVVVSVEFDENGALKTVHFNDKGMADTIPAAGFSKVLVRTAPISIQ